MRQYKYILFRDGKPWKGMYNEVDFMNAYDEAFQEILRKTESWLNPIELAREFATIKFFKKYKPAEYSSKGYRSLLKDYIIGANENEGSIVYGIDWDDLSRREKSLFNFIDEEFKEDLDKLNKDKKFDMPDWGVSRGTGALNKL